MTPGKTEPRTWTLTLPFNRPLSLNDRGHWARRAKETNAWRDTAWALARSARLPRLDTFTVVLHYAPRTKGRRDVDNLVISLKHVVDGLVVAGVCEDDDSTRYRLSSPIIHPATGEPGRLWVDVIDLGGGL